MNVLSKIALVGLMMALPSLTGKTQPSGTWTSTGGMGAARYAFSGVQLRNGKVLIAGGIDGTLTVLATAELYDPLTGAWTPTGNMKKERAYYTATLLPNGRVLVAGGCTSNNCSTATNTAEIYDPPTGIWRPAGIISTLRYFFHATLLSNGSVLVAAGCNQGNCVTVTATAELFNPRTHQWMLTGSMHTARDYHTATLLAGGNVLVTRGYTIQGATNSVEMYDLITGIWSVMSGHRLEI
jgi:WD40 repeat protein